MLYMFLAIAAFLGQSLGNKEFGRRIPETRATTAFYNALALTLCAGVFAAKGGVQWASTPSMLLAVVFGILFVVTITLFIKAYASGPLGLTALLLSLSMILPVLAGVLFFHEHFTIKSITGILCILVVLVLSSNPGAGKGTVPLTRRWFLICLLGLICNGSLSIVQKTQQTIVGSGELDAFAFWGFFFAAVSAWALTGYYLLVRKEKPLTHRPALYATAAAMGAGSAVGNYCVMAAIITVPAIVVYPVVLGGMVMCNWAASLIIYKEKTNIRSIITMVIGLVGIVLMSI